MEAKAHAETVALSSARDELKKAQLVAEAEKQALADEHQNYLNKQLKVAEAEHARVLAQMEDTHNENVAKVCFH